MSPYIMGWKQLSWAHKSKIINVIAKSNASESPYLDTSGGQWHLRWGMTISLWEWPYFYYSMLDDCHSYSIHPAQCNINRFRLLHDSWICPILIMRLLQPSLQLNVYNVGAQVERQIGVIKVTDSDTFNTALHAHASM